MSDYDPEEVADRILLDAQANQDENATIDELISQEVERHNKKMAELRERKRKINDDFNSKRGKLLNALQQTTQNHKNTSTRRITKRGEHDEEVRRASKIAQKSLRNGSLTMKEIKKWSGFEKSSLHRFIAGTMKNVQKGTLACIQKFMDEYNKQQQNKNNDENPDDSDEEEDEIIAGRTPVRNNERSDDDEPGRSGAAILV